MDVGRGVTGYLGPPGSRWKYRGRLDTGLRGGYEPEEAGYNVSVSGIRRYDRILIGLVDKGRDGLLGK